MMTDSMVASVPASKTEWGGALTRLLAREPTDVRRAIEVLGEVLSGGRDGEGAAEFIARALDIPIRGSEVEKINLSAGNVDSIGAVLADLIAKHTPELGPATGQDEPTWRRLDNGLGALSVPDELAMSFQVGTLAEVPIVIVQRETPYSNYPELLVHVRVGHRAHAQTALDAILESARGERNLYRGRVIHVSSSFDHTRSIALSVLPNPSAARDELILSRDVWAEIDLAVEAVRDSTGTMRSLGFGTQRGILIVGPPGVGKTAISRVLASELTGEFTTLVVDSSAGKSALRAVYDLTTELGPTLVVLDDLDLYIGARNFGGGGGPLAGLLAVLDGAEAYDHVLTIATTNDATSLDSAATRSARFDSILQLPYPDSDMVIAILERYLSAVPDAAVDTVGVAARLPADVSGADIREIVRRTVLAAGTTCTTRDMLATVEGGRWKAAPLAGNYL